MSKTEQIDGYQAEIIAYFLKNLTLLRFINTLNREVFNGLLLSPFIHSLHNFQINANKKNYPCSEL